VALSADSDEAEGSALIDLLRELREIFKERDRISSADLAEHLGSKPESRWSEWSNGKWSHGKPITQRQVARLLAPLKIKPTSIRVGTDTPREYLREWFEDAFDRYIPPISPSIPPTIRNTATSEQNQGVKLENDPQQNGDVADRKSDLNSEKIKNVADVADRKGVLAKRDPWERVA
jgi:putative DNA primase/helicase